MARGGYTPDQIKNMTQDELYFIYYYQNKVDDAKISSLSEILGVMFDFDRQDFSDSSPQEHRSPSNKLYVPLSFILQPDFAKKIAEMSKSKAGKKVSFIGGGEYKPKQNESVVSMADMSKDDFLKFIGKRQ
jgi:hypothetical protein